MAQNSRSLADIILVEIFYLLSPLRQLDSPKSGAGLMRDLGWELPSENLFMDGFPSLVPEIANLIQNSYKIEDACTSDNYITLLKALKSSIESVINIITKVDGLQKDIRSELKAYSDFLGNSGIATEKFPERLLDYLLFVYLEGRQPEIFGILNLLGIVGIEEYSNSQKWEPEPTYALRNVYWNRILGFLVNPLSVANEVYDWNPQ